MRGGIVRVVPSREVYPNAPLVLVAAEIRHPDAGPLSPRQQQRLKAALADVLPLTRSLRRAGMVASFPAPGQPPQVKEVPEMVSPRFVSRDQTTSVTVNQDALVVETTAYPGFERFLVLLRRALTSRLDAGPLDGVERVGLRYIDEIRVPSVGEASAWSDWVQPAVLGPDHLADEVGLSPQVWQGVAAYAGSLSVGGGFDKLALVLRYGIGDGYAVDTGDQLRRATPPPGPFFLVDIDSYWSSSNNIPLFDPDTVASVVEGLHTPVRDVFERLITNRLRDEVLRRHGD